MPATSGNEPVRALVAQLGGPAALKIRTGRQQQGALHLFRHYCEHRRCYECPIARLATGEPWAVSRGPWAVGRGAN